MSDRTGERYPPFWGTWALPRSGSVSTCRRAQGCCSTASRARGLELLIGHPGGPLWANRNEGAWSIVKGEIEEGEEPLAAAVREFAEETGMALEPDACLSLGEARQRSGKRVLAWACLGELEPGELTSATFELEWPPRSGRMQQFPELDEVRWCAPDEARALLNPAQTVFVGRLEALLGATG